jgi:lysophospholipase L1-like esterase
METQMTRLLFVLLTASALAGPLTPKDLAGRRIMVLGDSITNSGSYVSMMLYELLRQHPDADFDVVSIGLSSETASCLSEADHPFPRPCIHERLDRALAAVKPDIVIACYGMNDGIYHPPSEERQRAYESGIQKLIDKAKAAGVDHVVLLTPGTFDNVPTARKVRREPPLKGFSYKAPYTDYNQVLANFADWIMSVKQPGVHSIDIHRPMASFVADKRQDDPGYTLARDGIHPQPVGHLVMAQAILAGFGVQSAADLASVTADPLYKQVDAYRQLRSKGWLDYVGYTRGKTVKRDRIDDIEAAAAEQLQAINTLRRK